MQPLAKLRDAPANSRQGQARPLQRTRTCFRASHSHPTSICPSDYFSRMITFLNVSFTGRHESMRSVPRPVLMILLYKATALRLSGEVDYVIPCQSSCPHLELLCVATTIALLWDSQKAEKVNSLISKYPRLLRNLQAVCLPNGPWNS